MNSEEIKTHRPVDFDPPEANIIFTEECAYSIAAWLQEIAYQLAVGNEQRQAEGLGEFVVGQPAEYVKYPPPHLSTPGASIPDSLAAPVRSGSGSEVRGDSSNLFQVNALNCPQVQRPCAFCGRPMSEHRRADERTSPPNPQTSPIQNQEKP